MGAREEHSHVAAVSVAALPPGTSQWRHHDATMSLLWRYMRFDALL